MLKIIEVNSVTAGYEDNVVLSNINLNIYKNDFIGVIGPNGGGKTTFLKLLLGLIKPMKGNVEFVADKKIGFIGYLPQFNNIDKQFPISVVEVVLSGLMSEKKIWQSYSSKDKNQAIKLLDSVGMKKLKDKSIGKLSGGQLQRVFLCRAIIAEPQLLILDEPDTYVDSNFEGELYEMLDELNKRMAIVIVSHDVGTICSHVKTIACINGALCYHDSNIISKEQLKAYNCPIDLITHGEVPHRVLKKH